MRTILFLVIVVGLSSCVRAIKYQELQAQYDQAEISRTKALARADSLEKSRTTYFEKYQTLQKENARITSEYASVDSLYKKNKRLTDDLFDKYEKVQKSYSQLLANGSLETGRLTGDLSKKERDLQAMEQKVQALNADLTDRETRINLLEKKISEKEKVMADLKNKITNALLGFNSTELTITNKDGRIYVSLSEKLLFQSGSYNVDTKGADALKKLAAVLKTQADISVLVEGHTDDVPISAGTAGMKDNWDLSVLRATAISRILLNGGLQGEKITAAGRSKYAPLNPAQTVDARRKNRRIEVILTPNLEELYKMLGK
jgi:chemotaxis protein MotB